MCIRDSKKSNSFNQSTSRLSRSGDATATVRSSAAVVMSGCCLLYTSDAADERSSVDLGGRRIIKKKTNIQNNVPRVKLQISMTMHTITQSTLVTSKTSDVKNTH